MSRWYSRQLVEWNYESGMHLALKRRLSMGAWGRLTRTRDINLNAPAPGHYSCRGQ